MAIETSAQTSFSSATTTSKNAATSVDQLMGFSVAETTGSGAASFRLRDASGTGNPITAKVALAANESVRDWFGSEGIVVPSGVIYLEVLSGSIELAVWYV